MKLLIVVLVVAAVLGALEGKHTSKRAIKKIEKGARAALKDLKVTEHALRKVASETLAHEDTPQVFLALRKAKRELKKVEAEAEAIKDSK